MLTHSAAEIRLNKGRADRSSNQDEKPKSVTK